MILNPDKLTEGMWIVCLNMQEHVVVPATKLDNAPGTPLAMFQYKDEAMNAAMICNRHTKNFNEGVFKRLKEEKQQAHRDLAGLCLEALK